MKKSNEQTRHQIAKASLEAAHARRGRAQQRLALVWPGVDPAAHLEAAEADAAIATAELELTESEAEERARLLVDEARGGNAHAQILAELERTLVEGAEAVAAADRVADAARRSLAGLVENARTAFLALEQARQARGEPSPIEPSPRLASAAVAAWTTAENDLGAARTVSTLLGCSASVTEALNARERVLASVRGDFQRSAIAEQKRRAITLAQEKVGAARAVVASVEAEKKRREDRIEAYARHIERGT